MNPCNYLEPQNLQRNLVLTFLKSFHSFRHSVETNLTNVNVNARYIDFLQGHSQKGIGGSVYMKGIKPEVLLKDCVEMLKWDVDWNKLKVKW